MLVKIVNNNTNQILEHTLHKFYYYVIDVKQTKCQIMVQLTVDRRIFKHYLERLDFYFSAHNIGLDYKSADNT